MPKTITSILFGVTVSPRSINCLDISLMLGSFNLVSSMEYTVSAMTLQGHSRKADQLDKPGNGIVRA